MISRKLSATFVVLSAFCVFYASANPVSLFIPGADDDQPFTADLLGTDSSGQTTWRIGVGVSSGSYTATDGAGAYPSVTIVEGSTGAHIIQAIPTDGATDPSLPTQAAQDCVFTTPSAGGTPLAVCTVLLEAASETSTMVQTFTGNVIEVQVAATVTGATGSTATSSSGGASPTRTATSGGSTVGTQSSGTASPTQTGSASNGAAKTSYAGIPLLALVGLTHVVYSVIL